MSASNILWFALSQNDIVKSLSKFEINKQSDLDAYIKMYKELKEQNMPLDELNEEFARSKREGKEKGKYEKYDL